MPAPKALCRRCGTRRSRTPGPGTGRRGCLRRASCVRVQTRQCTVLADLEARPRAPPWRTLKLRSRYQMALLTHLHRERAHPGGVWSDSGCRCLALCCGNKYTQTMSPRLRNRLLSSACGVCADVPACVCGRASVHCAGRYVAEYINLRMSNNCKIIKIRAPAPFRSRARGPPKQHYYRRASSPRTSIRSKVPLPKMAAIRPPRWSERGLR